MVKILDVPIAQNSLQRTDPVLPTTPDLTGSVIESFGRNLDKFNAESEKRDAAAFVSEQRAGLQLKHQQRFEELKTTHEDINSFSSTVMEEFDADVEELVKNAPNPLAATALGRNVESLRTNIGMKAIQFQGAQKVALQKNSLQNGMNAKTNSILLNPDEFENVVENIDGDFAAADTVMTPAESQEYKTNSMAMLAEAKLRSEIARDPQNALLQLENNHLNQFLKPDDAFKIKTAALRAIEKEEKETDKLVKERQAKQEFEFSNRVIEGSDIPTLDEINDAVELGEISPRAGQSLQKMVINPPAREDNPYVMAGLDTALINGELSTQDIMENAGELSSATRARYLKSITSGIHNNPAVKRGVSLLDAQVQEESLGVRALEDEKWFASAKEELITRSLGGEEVPLEVAKDIIANRQIKIDDKRTTRRKRRIVSEVGNTRQALTNKKTELFEQRSNNLISVREFEESFNAITELLKEAK